MNIPYVIEQTHRGERMYDLYSRLLKDRIVMIGTAINDDVANIVIAQLLTLESDDPDKPVFMYLNSPGGSATAGLAIYDTMKYVRPPVSTICTGQVASMAAILLLAGEKGKRFALPNSRILLHQPMGAVEGVASHIDIQAREILRMKEKIIEIISEHTGKSMDRIKADTERNYFMGAEEARQYGIIDQIAERPPPHDAPK